MKTSLKKTTTLLVLILSLFINGCNVFEAVDSSVNKATDSDLIQEGNARLDEADYATALNRFERALEKSNTDMARRGKASANAGLAGFNMFTILDCLQNDIVAPNTSEVVFKASKNITNLDNLNKAIDDMNLLVNPTKEDLLFRSLMASVAAAKTITTKYDTNLNKKLDLPDQINFTTNDNKTMSWEALYMNLSSSSSPYSLEKAYIELSKAFNGRGDTLVTMSPFNSVTKSGTYTQANYNTIVAIGDLGLKIKSINLKYNNSVSEFKSAIIALDGVD